MKAVIKHQIWSQTITQTHVTLYKKCIKRELANEDEIAAKKGKMVTLETKCELNINGVTEEIADGVGGVGTATTEETPHLHQRNLLEGNSPINERSNRKDKDIPKEVTLLF